MTTDDWEIIKDEFGIAVAAKCKYCGITVNTWEIDDHKCPVKEKKIKETWEKWDQEYRDFLKKLGEKKINMKCIDIPIDYIVYKRVYNHDKHEFDVLPLYYISSKEKVRVNFDGTIEPIVWFDEVPPPYKVIREYPYAGVGSIVHTPNKILELGTSPTVRIDSFGKFWDVAGGEYCYYQTLYEIRRVVE